MCFKGCAWGVRFVDRHVFEDSQWLGGEGFFFRGGRNSFLHIRNPDEIMGGPRPGSELGNLEFARGSATK